MVKIKNLFRISNRKGVSRLFPKKLIKLTKTPFVGKISKPVKQSIFNDSLHLFSFGRKHIFKKCLLNESVMIRDQGSLTKQPPKPILTKQGYRDKGKKGLMDKGTKGQRNKQTKGQREKVKKNWKKWKKEKCKSKAKKKREKSEKKRKESEKSE